MYFGTAAAWHLRLPALAEACAAGLIAELIYAPYDIVGNKFLWWTWHDTDSSIAARLFGVPIGSSMWVVTFSATFAYMFRSTTGQSRFNSKVTDSLRTVATPEAQFPGIAQLAISIPSKPLCGMCKYQLLSIGDCCLTIMKLSALSTPIMMVQMTIFQLGTGVDLIIANGGLPPSPPPGIRSFVVCLLVYGYIIVRSLSCCPLLSLLLAVSLSSWPASDLVVCATLVLAARLSVRD
jgi:hypothetical protein